MDSLLSLVSLWQSSCLLTRRGLVWWSRCEGEIPKILSLVGALCFLWGLAVEGGYMLSYHAFYAGDHVTKENKERLVHKYKYPPPTIVSTLQSKRSGFTLSFHLTAFSAQSSYTLQPCLLHLLRQPFALHPQVNNRTVATPRFSNNYRKSIDPMPQLAIASSPTHPLFRYSIELYAYLSFIHRLGLILSIHCTLFEEIRSTQT
jgi:hypothetical protein